MDGSERLLIVGEQSYRCARGRQRMSIMVLDLKVGDISINIGLIYHNTDGEN